MGFALLSVLFGAGEILLLAHLMQLYSPFLLMGAYYACTATMTLARRSASKASRTDQSWRGELKNLALYAVGGMLGNALWFASLYLMGASSVAVLSMVQRVLIMIYSARYMDEPMSPWQWGIAIVMIALTGVFSAEGDQQDWLGLGLCILSYVVFSVSDVAQKRIAARVPWTTALTLRQVLQFVVFGSAALVYGVTVSGFGVYGQWAFWLPVLGAAIMGGVLSKICHYHAISRVALNRVVLVEQLEAVLVFFLGVALFSHVSFWSLQGAAGLGIVACLLAFVYLERVESPHHPAVTS